MRQFEFLIKYLVSYILLLVLPMLLLLGFLQAHSIRLIEENFSAVQQGAVLQASNALEMEMERIHEILPRIKQDTQFSIANLDSGNSEYLVAVGRLKDFVVYSNIIQSAVIYNGEERFALSDRGTFPARYFGGEICRFEGYTEAMLRARIEAMRDSAVSIETVELVGGAQQRCLVHWFPFEDYSNQAGSMLMVFVGLSAMDEILESMRSAEQSVFAILDREGRLLTQTGAEDIDAAALFPMVESYSSGASMVRLGGEPYFVAYQYSLQDGWTYLYAARYLAITNELASLRSRYVTLFLAIMAASGLLIYGFLRLNYLPIKRLKRRVEDTLQLPGKRNELETIQEAFSLLAERIAWVDERLQKVQPAMACYGAMALLRGEEVAEPYLEAMGRGGHHWLVALAHPARPEAAVRYLRENAPLCLGGEGSFAALRLPDAPCVLLLLGGREASGEDMRRTARLLASGYLGMTGESLPLYVGGDHARQEEIPEAYRQALLAFALSALESGEGVTDLAAQIRLLPQSDGVLSGLLQAVEAALITRDAPALLQMTEDLRHLEWSRITRHAARDFLLSLLRLAGQNLRDESMRQWVQETLVDGMGEYERRADAPAFLAAADQVLRALARSVARGGKAQESATFLQTVLDAVDAHYLDADFSLASMARMLDVSPSWLSHFFKDARHMTLIEYVNGRKMEKARQMMRETAISLAELSEMLGYQSVSSFIRSFKKETHMTPGQYRASCRKKE